MHLHLASVAIEFWKCLPHFPRLFPFSSRIHVFVFFLSFFLSRRFPFSSRIHVFVFFLSISPISVFLPHTHSFSFSLSICSPGASSLHCNRPEHCIPALRPLLVPVCFTNCLQPLPCLRCIGPIQASHVPASGTRALYSSIPALVPRTPLFEFVHCTHSVYSYLIPSIRSILMPFTHPGHSPLAPFP